MTLALSVVCWWGVQASGVDQATAVTAAAGLAAVSATLGGVWVARAGGNDESQAMLSAHETSEVGSLRRLRSTMVPALAIAGAGMPWSTTTGSLAWTS